MWQRVEVARSESDTALFFDLMYLGEMLSKMVVAAMLAGLTQDRDRHRYRLEHQLVRANGIGEWVTALDDLLTGPASQHLVRGSNAEKQELMQNWLSTDDTWQRRVVDQIDVACNLVDT